MGGAWCWWPRVCQVSRVKVLVNTHRAAIRQRAERSTRAAQGHQRRAGKADEHRARDGRQPARALFGRANLRRAFDWRLAYCLRMVLHSGFVAGKAVQQGELGAMH
jgi:hypothetical protein